MLDAHHVYGTSYAREIVFRRWQIIKTSFVCVNLIANSQRIFLIELIFLLIFCSIINVMQDLVKVTFVMHQLIDGQVSSLIFSVFKLLLLLELFNLVMQLFLSCLRSRCLSLCFVVTYVFDRHFCILQNFHANFIWNEDPDELQSFELLSEGGKFRLILLLENFSHEIFCSISCLCF